MAKAASLARAPKGPDFERSLEELEKLIERLEGGDLPLDEALKTFERGVELTRQCQNALKGAQQKVEILLKRNEELITESFEVLETEAPSPAPEE